MIDGYVESMIEGKPVTVLQYINWNHLDWYGNRCDVIVHCAVLSDQGTGSNMTNFVWVCVRKYSECCYSQRAAGDAWQFVARFEMEKPGVYIETKMLKRWLLDEGETPKNKLTVRWINIQDVDKREGTWPRDNINDKNDVTGK